MKNTFLFVLWRQHKVGFFAALVFLLGQGFFIYKGVETVPFFNYGMYSSPATAATTYEVINLYKGTDLVPLSQLSNAPAVLQYQLNYYNYIREQQYIDPISKTIEQRFGAYPSCANYLQKQLLTSKTNLIHFEEWLDEKYQANFSIKKESFEWVNGHFKKVSHYE